MIELPPPPPVVVNPVIQEVQDEDEIEQEVVEIFEIEEPIVNTKPIKKQVSKKIKKHIKKVVDNNEPWIVVEKQPEFPGGLKAFYKYIGKKLKYPKQARRMGVQGTVYIQFVVDKDGSLSEIKVLKGIGAGCNEEALRVLKNSPKWEAGRQRGRAVRVKMSIPIKFLLNR